MKYIFQIRSAIGRFIKYFELIWKGAIKFIACFYLFRFVSMMPECPGTGLANSVTVRLVVSGICLLLPARCAVFLAIILGLYNMYQVTLLGAALAACFFLVLYVMTSRLFPDHAWLIALVPLFLHYKLYIALPLVAGMYMGLIALIPLIMGVIMDILLKLIPVFLNLSMPKKLDELPGVLSSVIKYVLNQLMHNEMLVFLIVVFTAVIVLVAILRTMKFSYGNYISLAAGTVLGIFCLSLGRTSFHFPATVNTIVTQSLLVMLVLLVGEFMRAALDYQSIQRVNFEDEEYKYFVTIIPKISIGKSVKERKTITETAPQPMVSVDETEVPYIPNAPVPEMSLPTGQETQVPQETRMVPQEPSVSQETQVIPQEPVVSQEPAVSQETRVLDTPVSQETRVMPEFDFSDKPEEAHPEPQPAPTPEPQPAPTPAPQNERPELTMPDRSQARKEAFLRSQTQSFTPVGSRTQDRYTPKAAPKEAPKDDALASFFEDE